MRQVIVRRGSVSVEGRAQREAEWRAVTSLVSNGPAAVAGLRPGDLLLELNGSEVRSCFAFMNSVKRMAPGEKAAMKIERDGEIREVTVTLGELTGFEQGAETDVERPVHPTTVSSFYISRYEITDVPVCVT